MIARISLVCFICAVLCVSASPRFVAATSDPPSTPVSGKHGAIATEVAACSQIGLQALKDGGTAADAIIASSLCVGVINSFHSGIGGGGFGIVRYPTASGHAYEMIDFREAAPAGANQTLYTESSDKTASTVGGLANGIPGEIRGWQSLHHRHGKLAWARLFAPAVDLARNGFPVSVDLANAFKGYPFLLSDPLFAESFAPNGTLLTLGQTCYRKRYADVLEAIGYHGADWYYEGENAQSIANASQSRGGILTVQDLKNYTAILRKPASIKYRNHRIFSTIAPSSGSVVLSALKIFSGFNGSASDTDPAINETTHYLIEATRLAYAQRTNFGDPAFTANVSALEKSFLTDKVASEARAKISPNRTYPDAYYDIGKYAILNDSGTSHLAAADSNGYVVSLTTTINLYWGSQVMTDKGIILNDEMDDFSSPGQTNSFGFAAAPANFIQPGKRPQSSIASSIVEDLDGNFVEATGSAGGSRIITATLQNIYHYLDQALSANATVHHSRWHDQLTNVTYFEYASPQVGIPGYSNSTVAFLTNQGYNVTYEDTTGSTGHVVALKDGIFTAASDPRKAAGRGSAY
ncbi:uncharacterized protein L969DRAFT_18069 [Mixia osmundae IAM 14324]|uniref:Glutathione hydrolase n=1 Tax=Mixia osmundae (strain CBS 9802 / IAM 14324 / JCM 22182 / KY 12970) TaxID=764103 RepID=G7E707_MIXOS|nr:uncharacterized protein L969DRAFT_18069 [Mixia osmundae IAM 14324]KEI39001.1 hypothetical protein L969DRAFT_18069 [Mixia osmundae IAM 14324]GAA98617.1 hypothetical protein E5Q_05304 [Mixia osmundae IAM 14324]